MMLSTRVRNAPIPHRRDVSLSGVRLDRALVAIAIGIAAPTLFIQAWPAGSQLWLVLLAASLLLCARHTTATAAWLGTVALAFAVPANSALLVALLVAVWLLAIGRLRGVPKSEGLLGFAFLMTAVLVAVAVAGPIADRSMWAVVAGGLVAGHVYAAGWIISERCWRIGPRRRWVAKNRVAELANAAFVAVVAASMGHLVALAAAPPDEFVWPVVSWVILPGAVAGLAVAVAAQLSRPLAERQRDESVDARLQQLELVGLAVRGRRERVATLAVAVANDLGLTSSRCDDIVDAVVWADRAPDLGSKSVRIIEIVSAYDQMVTVRPGSPAVTADRALAELRRVHTRPLATQIIDCLQGTIGAASAVAGEDGPSELVSARA